jgi:hypothetical protein
MVDFDTLFLSLSLFPVAPTLEHRESVKRFVSLQFLNPKTISRDHPAARPFLHKENKRRQTSMP